MTKLKEFLEKHNMQIKKPAIIFCVIYVALGILFALIQTPKTHDNTENNKYQIIYGAQMQQAPEEPLTEDYGQFLHELTQKTEAASLNDETMYVVPSRTDIDFTTFDASYNKLVYNAQSQVNTNSEEFSKWFESLDGYELTDKSDWSAIFVSWCAYKSGLTSTNTIPITDSAEDFVIFYKDQSRFYRGVKSCLPRIGDIIIFDENRDGKPDKTGILVKAYNDDSLLEIIRGDVWRREVNEYVVEHAMYDYGDPTIYGICRPQNIIRHIDSYAEVLSSFPMNALDTVVPIRKEEHVKIMAEDGIEVIARYINPEGRTPLSKREVQMFSNYGIRSMMIYQIGKGDPYDGYDKGYLFGTRALEYARNLDATKGTPIFFCVDTPDQQEDTDKLCAFLQGARDAMQGEYGVGIYGGFYTIQAMSNAGVVDAVWQTWGFSGGYISPEYDMLQWSSSTEFWEEIPIVFDANHVKDVEKVSFILPPTSEN